MSTARTTPAQNPRGPIRSNTFPLLSVCIVTLIDSFRSFYHTLRPRPPARVSCNGSRLLILNTRANFGAGNRVGTAKTTVAAPSLAKRLQSSEKKVQEARKVYIPRAKLYVHELL